MPGRTTGPPTRSSSTTRGHFAKMETGEQYGDAYPVEVQWGRPRRLTAADRRPRIVVLPGDGIGPEIVAAARRLLDAPRPEQGLLGLRKGLGLYANLRPVRPSEALAEASPLRPERITGTDLLVVRELTGGIYFGDRGRSDGEAHDTCVYTVAEIERIARTAFDSARSRSDMGTRGPKVTSVDKANVLETSRLWRETVARRSPAFADALLA